MPHKDLERKKQYHKEYRSKNSSRISLINRQWNLKKKYNISLEDYNKMLKEQNHCCAICKRHEKSFTRGYSLAVDHCHKTGKIRGLVCYRCNLALENGIDWFKAGVKYLDNSEEKIYTNG